jgi:hypothetical protein
MLYVLHNFVQGFKESYSLIFNTFFRSFFFFFGKDS